ncbi:MAG: hypothetical protein H6834_06315 [Planctomycetes bacterium]|nr:hypothetical protein [Planctomycetota bacterium]
MHSSRFVLAFTLLASTATSQSTPYAPYPYELISIFAPVRSSVPEARYLFTPEGLRPTVVAPQFDAGDWIEIDLPRDEEARPARIAYLTAYALDPNSNPQQTFDLWIKATETSPFVASGTFEAGGTHPYYPNPFPTHIEAVTVRLVAQAPPSSTFQIWWIGVASLYRTSRPVHVLEHGWYRQPPTQGTETGLTLEFDLRAQDLFGILLAAPASAALSQPLYAGLPGNGGLLLDPNAAQVMDTEMFLGAPWRVTFRFPFDPALLGAPIHLQAAYLGQHQVFGTVLDWSPPLVF